MSTVAMWAKENVGQVVMTMFFVGTAYGALRVENHFRDTRINKLEAVQIEQVKWEVQRTSAEVGELKASVRTSQGDIANINAKLDVMAQQINYIAETLKSRP
jgi:hypothetical protein